MDHLILNNGSDGAALAEVALKALREARSSKTSSSGSIFVSDGQTDDDGIALGTGTIINGVDGGIQPWVGDTTPPGKPTGLSVSSKNAAVIVNWAGSMEGGEPLDWGHLQLLATDDMGNDYDFGVLYGAGSQQLADMTPGAKLTVWAIGYDDAHDAQGNSTPNASTPSDSLTVTVESAVDPKDLEKAQDDAQSALNQAGQAITTSNDAKNAAQEAKNGNVTGYSQQYAQNGDPTTAPTTEWSDTAPSWVDGKYIWVRTVVTHGDGTTETTDPIVVTGNNGAKGDAGAQGVKGATGATGVSVSSITPYWAIASSAPAKPTTDTPPSQWSATEPAYNVGQNLYRTEKVLYSDSSFAYTSVQLDSTYQYAALAKTTADGKNKIFSSATQPSSTVLVPGDLWFQLDTNKNVSGIQVWNGSAFTDMVLLANKLLVASSVGTTQIADNAIVTGKIAANAITAIKIAANTITGDKLDVGSVTAAIITSGLFQTSDGLKGFDSSTGYWVKDADGNYLFHVDSDGKVTMSEATIKSVAAGDGVMIGPNVSSTVTGKPWITMDGMAVKFDTSSAVNPTLSGFSHKTESGVSSPMNAISINSGKTTSTSGDGVVYAQSDTNGNSAAGFEVYDSKGNFAAGAWGIEDGHLYLSGFRANGMWSARDYEPAYRVKLSDSGPAKGQQANYQMSYAYPVPFGNRSVIGSAETAARGMVFVPLNMSASGFTAGFYNASGGGTNLFLNFIAPWIYGGIKWA